MKARLPMGLLASIGMALSPVALASADDPDLQVVEACQKLMLKGFTPNDCEGMALVLRGQCIGLMNGRGYEQMMYTSSIMANAKTVEAQLAILTVAVDVFCPGMASELPVNY